MKSKLGILQSILKLIGIFLMIWIRITHQVITGNIVLSQTQINTASTYQFELYISSNIPSGGSFDIQFPTGVITISSSSIYTCTPIQGFTSSGTLSCASSSTLTNSIKVQGSALPNTDLFLIFTVSGITNPNYVSTFFNQVVSYSTASSSSSLLETSGSISFTTTPGTLLTTFSATGSTSTGSYTNLLITISNKNIIASNGGYISIFLPKWNLGTQNVNTASSYFYYAPSDFTSTYNGYSIDCSVTGNPNARCIFTVNTPTSISSISTTYDVLKINGFSNDIAAGSSIVININNNRFRNPFSLQPLQSVTISSYNIYGYNIDTQTSGFSYTALSGTIISSGATVTASKKDINQLSQYDFTITIPLPLPIGTLIYLTVPSQIGLYSDTANQNLALSSATGYSPISSVLSPTVYSSQIVLISNAVPSGSYYADAGSIIRFTLLYLKNPGSIQPSSSFQISFYALSYLIMSVTSGLTITSTGGILQSLTVLPYNFKTRKDVSYKFTFQTSNVLPSGGGVTITLPSSMSVNSTNLKTVTGLQAVSSQAYLSYQSSTNKIFIINAFTQAYQAGQIVQFSINSGILNPYSTQQSTNFVVQTSDSLGYAIDIITSSTITATANKIPSVLVVAKSSSSGGVCTTSQLCSYNLVININISYPIVVYSTILIILPQELIVNELTSANMFSYVYGISNQGVSFYINQTGYVTITNAFQPNGTFQNFYTLPKFGVVLTNITSPRSTKPTSSFRIYVYDSNSYVEYKTESGVYGTATQASSFVRSSYYRSNQINGLNATYTFNITLSLQCLKNEYIKVQPPQGVYIKFSQFQCKGIQGLQSNLACSIKDNAIYILMIPSNVKLSVFPKGTVLAFSIDNVYNPISLVNAGSFQVYISTSISEDYHVNQETSALNVQNQWANNLTNVMIIPDSNQLGVTAGYNFYFTLTNPIPLQGSIQIYFPVSVYGQISNISCTALQNMENTTSCNQTKYSNNSIIIANGFLKQNASNGLELGLRINNVKNPKNSVLQFESFVLRTIDQHGYIIDSTFNLNFTIGCVQPCLSCLNDQSSCTSCSNSNPLQVFYLFQFSCQYLCPLGYFGNNSYYCQQCNYPCQSCFESASQCTSCIQSSGLPYLYDQTSKCYDQCPVNTFISQQSSSCEDCITPCKQCKNPSDCLTCIDSYYFYSDRCYSKCPNISVPINSQQVLECETCKAPCKTCETKKDNCTSCKPGYYFYQNQCPDKCPQEYLPDDNSVCVRLAETTYPFLSLIFTISVLLIVIVSNKLFPRTRFFTAFLALESLCLVPLWIYLLAFLIKDKFTSSSGMIVFALICNTTINIFWYFYYKKKILPLDKSYVLFKDHYPKVQKAIMIISIVFTFQFFRIQYSRLFNIKQFCCVFSLKEKYYKKLNRYSLFQITFVFLPVIAANIYNLNWTWHGRQVFWIDIESIITSVLLFACHTIVIIRSEHKYVETKDFTQIDYIMPQTTLNTSQKNNNMKGGLMALQGKETREKALSKIVSKIKNNKESLEILGMQKENKGGDNLLEFQGDTTYSVGISGHNMNEYGKYDINHKPYQSENKYQRIINQLGFSNNKYLMLGQDSSRKNDLSETKVDIILGKETAQKYKELQQETSREEMTTTQIFNEMDFQSAPISAQKSLNKNPILQQRYMEFQQELFEKNKADKSNISNDKNSAIKGKNLNEIYQKFDKKDNTDEFGQGLIHTPKEGDQDQNKASSYYNTHHQLKSKLNFNDGRMNSRSSIRNQDQFYNINEQEMTFDNSKAIEDEIQQSELLQKYELGKEKKKLDQKIIEEIKMDISNAKAQKKDFKQELMLYSNENQNLKGEINESSQKVQEEHSIIQDLNGQITDLLRMLEQMKKKRVEDLQFIEKANFTEDEEDMGISPSSYNVLNQRFQDIKDVQVYLNSMGDPMPKDALEQLRKLDSSLEDYGDSIEEENQFEPDQNFIVGDNGSRVGTGTENLNEENENVSLDGTNNKKTANGKGKKGKKSKKGKRQKGERNAKIVPYNGSLEKTKRQMSDSPKSSKKNTSLLSISLNKEKRQNSDSPKSSKKRNIRTSPFNGSQNKNIGRLSDSQSNSKIKKIRTSPFNGSSQDKNMRQTSHSPNNSKSKRLRTSPFNRSQQRDISDSPNGSRKKRKISKSKKSKLSKKQSSQKKQKQFSERTGQLNLHRSPSQFSNDMRSDSSITRAKLQGQRSKIKSEVSRKKRNYKGSQKFQFGDFDKEFDENDEDQEDENKDNNSQEYYNEEDEEEEDDNEELKDEQDLVHNQSELNKNLSKKHFLQMIEQESKRAMSNMKKMKNKGNSQEFEKYAESFLSALKKDFKDDNVNTKKLIDYIKELDEKEREHIEKKYKKKIEEQIEKRKKKKKKKVRRGPSKDEIAKYGPYFNYTPFERAVIETAGKAPYNNEQVELIVNKGYDQATQGFWSPSNKGGENNQGASPLSKFFGGNTIGGFSHNSKKQGGFNSAFSNNFKKQTSSFSNTGGIVKNQISGSDFKIQINEQQKHEDSNEDGSIAGFEEEETKTYH